MTLNGNLRLLGRVLRWKSWTSEHECFLGYRHSKMSSYNIAALKRSALFDEEKQAQKEAIGRIEKIEVEVTAKPGNATLVMNKNLSTPYDCAKHLSEHVTKKSVIALVDDHQPWDMHRPLPESCQLRLLSMLEKNPWICNTTFWRSCSFMLGAVVSDAFRDNISVLLHSFPPPNVQSGSFVLDAFLGLECWQPNPEELRALSREMIKLANKELPFERLVISRELAEEMFADNPYKLNHIANIFTTHNDIIIYRIGSHIDISRGPMMNHTGLLGRCTIAAVHKVEDIYRFQGVALPQGLMLNHFAFGILEDRAKKLNLNVGWQPDLHPELDLISKEQQINPN